MSRTVITILLALLATVALACENNQQSAEPTGDQAETPEQAEPEQAEAEEAAQKTASQTEIPEDQTMKGKTENANFFVVVEPKPNPIPFQELFELEVRVFSGEQDQNPAKEVSLDQLRVTMPAHGHGMKNEPKISKVSPGVFKVEGMRFHMQGEGEDGHWVIEPVISENGTIDRAKFDVQCCREQ